MLNTKKLIFRFYRNLTHILGPKFYKYKLFGIIHNYFIYLLKPGYISVVGKRIYLDDKDSLRLSTNPKARDFELEIFKTYIKPGNLVLDIGAHIGYCTVIFSQLTGRRGKVYAFEPAPDNLELLKKNVVTNKLDNVVIVPSAVTNINGKTRLFLSDSSQADHRVRPTLEKRRSIDINSIRIDDFFKRKIPRVSFVKIDVQGAEHDALISMSSLLNKNKKTILYTEYTPQYLLEFGVEPKRYIEDLISFGFQLYDINEREKKFLKTTPSVIKKRYHTQDGSMTNLLCIREPKNE